MWLTSILTLAVGLAMDATAVSASRGLAARELRARHFWTVALFFGGFQAAMPLVGWALGKSAGPLLERWDHWIAFLLLAGIGAKMIHEALGSRSEPAAASDERLFAPRVMLVLAVATSIDAMAAGFTLPLLGAPLVASLLVIGLTTALLSALGLALGRRFGSKLGPRLDVFGGVVLIVLGAKILIEHLSA